MRSNSELIEALLFCSLFRCSSAPSVSFTPLRLDWFARPAWRTDVPLMFGNTASSLFATGKKIHSSIRIGLTRLVVGDWHLLDVTMPKLFISHLLPPAPSSVWIFSRRRVRYCS